MSAFQFYPELGTGTSPGLTEPSLGTYILTADTKTLSIDAPVINPSFTEVRIATNAGVSGQGIHSIALGFCAGQSNQGAHSIAIGAYAGSTNQHANTIILNSSGSILDSDQTDALFVAPIRHTSTTTQLYYNPTTKEISYADVGAGASGLSGITGMTGTTGLTGSIWFENI